MSWKRRVGSVLGHVVLQVGAWSDAPSRGLTTGERALLARIFGAALDTSLIVVREDLRGLLNLSRRAFVIENVIHLPMRPHSAPPHLLVHEATHVWQFQHGGHAYIADSVWAQTLGDGYQLERGLLQGRRWDELNCEQQATLVEQAFVQRCFDGRPFVLRGRDWTWAFEAAWAALKAGQGASFTSSGGTRGR